MTLSTRHSQNCNLLLSTYGLGVFFVYLSFAAQLHNGIQAVPEAQAKAARYTSLGGDIDASTMPGCGQDYCRNFAYTWPDADRCTIWKSNATATLGNNCDPMDDDCIVGGFHRDCYCNLETGLWCGWACAWRRWWDFEDWFAGVCPEMSKPVDFSSLPECARNCLDDETFASGCYTQTSNCICAVGDLFGCHTKCPTDEQNQIKDWLVGTCNITTKTAQRALDNGTWNMEDNYVELYYATSSSSSARSTPTVTDTRSNDPAPPLSAHRRPLRWDEIFILIAASLIAAVAFACWIVSCVRGRPYEKSG